ncbi:hypothetical protein MBLNU457_4909t2 [Dothideomycetes sp. NU457]
MESQYAPGSPGLKRDRSIHQDEGPERKKQMLEGQNGHLSNGVSHSGDERAVAPKLEDISDSYIPFGTLLQRMAQQTYFDLEQTIDAMADVQISEPVTNGLGTQHLTDTSSASVDKKIRMMNFAQTHKDRYIKAWVLSQWGQNIKDIDKTIQLSMWTRQQDEATHLAADGIINLKHNMVAAKMPNPNIEGALQILSTGKAPWMPDLGYLPPKPLSAPKLLQTLRDMNFTLSARLNLAEELPPLFNAYTIANGRATFVVPGEFEVDLATVDEDPASPFYFIDIRLLFSPATSTTSDRLRTQLEGKVNEVLASGGLQACYDFLHGFVLTHKLNILYSQALEMSRGRWIDNISVQMVHRSVVVQYWKKQRSGRNWIELGIVSGKDKKQPSGQSVANSRISCRWFRRGQEVRDYELSLDLQNLSMEKVLDRIVATHATGKLNNLSESLGAMSRGTHTFDRSLQTSDAEASRCSLRLTLRPSSTVFAVGYEPATGNISLSPRTPNTYSTEQSINEDTAIDVAQVIRSLLCREVQSQVVRHAQSLGWQMIRAANQQSFRNIFQEDSIRRVILQDSRWGPGWALAASIDLSGMKWWVVRMSQGADGPVVTEASTLTTATFDSIQRDMLSSIEKHAIAEIGFSSLMEQLRAQNIAFDQRHGQDQLKSLSTSVRRLLKSRDHDAGNGGTSWCNELITLIHHSLQDGGGDRSSIAHILSGSLTRNATTRLLPYITRKATEECGISFDGNGRFEIMVETSLGQAILHPLRTRLRTLERLFSSVDIVLRNHFTVLKVSPERVSFAYSETPKLIAKVDLPTSDNEGAVQAQLQLSVGEADKKAESVNPHMRIHDYLQQTLNDSSSSTEFTTDVANKGFMSLCWQLRFTLPALRAFRELEAADPYARLLVHCRDGGSYGLEYRLSPSFSLRFSVMARRRNDKMYWHITEVAEKRKASQGAQDPAVGQRLVPEARTELNDLWKAQGKGWTGLRNGAYSESYGITELLSKVDEIVRRANIEDAPRQEDPQQAQQQQQKQNQQQQQPPKGNVATQQKQVKPQNKSHRGNQPNPADVVVLD